MASFISKPILINNTNTDIFVAQPTLESIVHGLVFNNTTDIAATLTIKLLIAGQTSTVYNTTIQPKSQYTWPKPINLQAGEKIIAISQTANAITAVYSVFTQLQNTITSTLTAKGEWSDLVTYAINDIVYVRYDTVVNGVTYPHTDSYLSLASSNINKNPRTETAHWMPLATGSAIYLSFGDGLNGGVVDFNNPSAAVSLDNTVVRTTGVQVLVDKDLSRATISSGYFAIPGDPLNYSISSRDRITLPILATSTPGENASNSDYYSISDTLVARNTVDTLTNKTLVSPILSGSISGSGNITLTGCTATIDTLVLNIGYTEKVNTATATMAYTVNLGLGTVHVVPLNGTSNTITMPAAAPGKSFTLFVTMTQANATITFSSSAKFTSAPIASITAGAFDLYSFVCIGTSWYGVQCDKGF
jgi:hypothetical protein